MHLEKQITLFCTTISTLHTHTCMLIPIFAQILGGGWSLGLFSDGVCLGPRKLIEISKLQTKFLLKQETKLPFKRMCAGRFMLPPRCGKCAKIAVVAIYTDVYLTVPQHYKVLLHCVYLVQHHTKCLAFTIYNDPLF